MTRSKVFKSGNSQAVRIPQELALPYGEVEITRRGETLVITPIAQQNGATLFDALAAIEGPIEREQPPMQEREAIL
ncbi:AbrB/MazE/SpoVT family DNA-binding domain-containing protein [Deinococcus detaillensis]|uniref:AbrB/MazE/SpoVT family DNA-binding domain-containing protein n=1 Tax=Deinococcus detaillensis TaxID=2592048 RepID=A0A553V5X6_9DEIO|nr:type II toxin-antitoxin system VapB family antitoxin [Deinococcus detaillensis]TSA87868.1 AbrB/MazE/SpoVT family DNA-binding domain-containing protein [Deinococcus detaillensis]